MQITTQVNADLLIPGFDDPVQDSQRVFRAALKALSEPGTLIGCRYSQRIPESLESSSWQLALALLDADTRLWLSPSLRQCESLVSNLRFHCQCPLTDNPAEADFALANADELPALSHLNWGCAEYPDRSTTLIIQVASISHEPFWQLTGPGIESRRSLRIGGLPAVFREALIGSRDRFPLGIDTLFCCAEQLVALPRTTRISEENNPCTLP